jgi:endonuclease/exonuclease/phosphatase family metal-dependent hydrolase
MKVGFLLLFTASVAIIQPALANTPGQERESLTVLTWNVFLRPRAILWGDHQSARAREMVQLLREEDYDVVVLQEAFDRVSLRILTEGLKDTYPHFILPGKRNPLHTNSGLLVLSRLPIERAENIFFNQCAGADCMVDKGAVLMQVSKGGRTYQVVGTHAQAEEGRKYAEIRASQYQQIRGSLLEAHAQEGITQLVVGDLNTDQSQHLEYSMMLHTLGTEDGEVRLASGDGLPCDGVYTWGCANNSLIPSKYRGETSLLDYVLLRANGRNATVDRTLHVFKRKWGKKGREDLSDHYALSTVVVAE